jgi:hypothetical protein
MPNTAFPAWPHVARAALAKRYLAPVLEFGVRALTLFAGRGIGKTAFILEDLIPLARQHHFMCVYVDLWECPEGPAVGIARALEAAATAGGKTAKRAALARAARRMLPSSLGEAGAEVHIFGQKAKLNLGFRPKPGTQAQHGERLLAAFEGLVKAAGKQQILLVLDEAQTLASPSHEALVRALRACFQRYDAQLVRVFTGSSRMGLERMFRRSRAPLFGQGGNVEVFPPLGQEFVREIARWFAQRTGGAVLGERAASEGFAKLRYSARLFRAAVEALLVGRAPNIAAACQTVMHDLVEDHELKARLTRLSDVQWAVLRLVWAQGRDLFGADTLAGLSKQLGRAVEPTQVQTALKRLERLELIYRLEHGEYRIELPELELIMENMA